MIIVEGMDNAGKTTLARQLAEDLPALYLNMRRKPKSERDIRDYVNQTSPLTFPTVFDRHPLFSDPVYGPVIRGTSLLTSIDEMQLLGRVRKLCPHTALVVYCRPPDGVILGTLEDREQMEGVTDNAKVLLELYDKKANLWEGFLHVWSYDYTRNEYPAFLSDVKEFIDVSY